jgi:hypothetical protein
LDRQDSNNSQCEINSCFSKAPGSWSHCASTRKGISRKVTVLNSEGETGVARQDNNNEDEDEDPFGLADSIGKSLDFKKDPNYKGNETMVELPKKNEGYKKSHGKLKVRFWSFMGLIRKLETDCRACSYH